MCLYSQSIQACNFICSGFPLLKHDKDKLAVYRIEGNFRHESFAKASANVLQKKFGRFIFALRASSKKFNPLYFA